MNRLLVICTALLFGCNSTKILQNEVAPGVDFTKYKTFDFLKTEASGDTIPGKYDEGITLVKEAVANEMTKRGYQRSSQNPDLFINLGIAVKQRAQTRETNWRTDGRMAYIGQRNYKWKSEEIVVGYYKEGTLDLNLVDAAANKMVWKATVKDILPEKSKNLPSTINAALASLFSRFPVAPK